MIRSAIAALALISLLGAPMGPASAEDSPKAEAKKELRQLDRITITGSASRAARVPGAAQKVDQEALTIHEGATDDALRVLMQLPGVTVVEEDGIGLRPNIGLRGSGSERSSRITLMEDGVLIAPAPYAAPSAYYFPSMGRMSALEVRKGSSTVRFGPHTTGGAINMISTPIPAELSGSLSYRGGEDGLSRNHSWVGDSNDHVDWLLEGYRLAGDGFKTLDFGGDRGFDVEDYIGKLRLHSGPESEHYQEVEFKFGYRDETSFETYLGLSAEDFDASPWRRYAASARDRMDSRRAHGQARYYGELSDSWDLTATAYQVEFARNWYKLDKVEGTSIATILAPGSTGFDNERAILRGEASSAAGGLAVKANSRDYDSQGLEVVAGWRGEIFRRAHEIEMGLRFHSDEMDRLQWTDDWTMLAGGTMQFDAAGAPGEGGGGNNRIDRARAVAAFLQDEIRLGDLTLSPGVRYEHIVLEREQFGDGEASRSTGTSTTNENTLQVVVPGVGVSWALPGGQVVLAGIHRGFSPPSPGSADEVEAEKSWNLELGARQTGNAFSAEVFAFLNLYENLLGTDTLFSGGPGDGQQFNGGEATVRGLETAVELDALAESGSLWSLPLRVSWTWTVAEFSRSFDSDYEPWGEVLEGDRLPYQPEQQLSFGVGAAHPRGRLDLTFNYQTSMRSEAGQGEIPTELEIEGRLLTDLHGTLQLRPGLALSGGVNNLANVDYVAALRPAGLRPGMPRTAFAGLSLTF